MSETFDPYYKWLAIPPKDQPPHHYRLLAIELFESDSDVIANAADQRMTHLKAFQTSQHGALSQHLLNEIAAARTTLLNPDKKQVYDTQLQTSMAGTSDPAIPPIRPQTAGKSGRPIPAARRRGDAVAPVEPVKPADPSRATSTARQAGAPVVVGARPSTAGGASTRRSSPPLKKPNRHEFKIKVVGHIIAPLVGLMLGYLVLCWIRPELSIFGSGSDDTRELTAVDDNGHGAETTDHSGGDNGDGSPTDGTTGSRTPSDDAHIQKPPEVTQLPDDGAGTSSLGTDPGASAAATDPADGDTSTTTTDGTNGDTSNGEDGEPGENGGLPLPTEPTLEEKLAELQDQLDKAVSGGNVSQALNIIQQIADLKEENALDAQAALLEQLHQGASSPAALKTLAENGLKLIDKAIAEGRAELAKRLANLTLLAARRADDIALVRQATQRVIAVQELEAN